MNRKLLCYAGLAALILLGAPSRAHPASFEAHTQARGQAQAPNPAPGPDSKTASGKVTSIGQDHKSLTIEVDDGGAKQNMQFVLSTAIRKSPLASAPVWLLRFNQMKDGQNLALTISPQGAQ